MEPPGGPPSHTSSCTCLAMPRVCCSAGQACWVEEPEAPSAQWEGRFLIPRSITDVCPGHKGWMAVRALLSYSNNPIRM